MFVYELKQIIQSGEWLDKYPNKTNSLLEAARSGPGTYDLFSVYGDITAICVSWTKDPRQLAANLLDKDLVKMEGNQPFFTREGSGLSIIIFDKNDGFRIEEIHSDDLYVVADQIRYNTCFNQPLIARIVVEDKPGRVGFAKRSANLEITAVYRRSDWPIP